MLRVMLVHQDEKWFFACVSRALAKQVVSLGFMPSDYKVQHKSHVEKTMIVCTTGYIPHDGNFESGGRAVKIAFDRVGGMVPSKRTTYKRGEPDAAGNYKMDGPVSKIAGKNYWQNWEIRGSQEQAKDGTPKFSLLVYFKDVLIHKLESIAREYGIIIYFQWDGAGPHTDKKLVDWLRAEFDKRGWIFKLQPSQSPITNISDACIFPSLSKKVSSNQAFNFKGIRKILKGDEIWDSAMAAWGR
jgi:hypothetical protein